MTKTVSDKKIKRMILAAMFLALALVLPLLTGQIPEIGNALLPMHLPVLLCGFFCGPWYGLAVGAVAPLLRFAIFGAPTLVPRGVAMCFELAAYGFFAGLLYRRLPKKPASVYIALIAAMLAGRIIWAGAQTAMVFMGVSKAPIGWAYFLAEAFTKAIPGIVLQIVLIPVLVLTLQKYAQDGRNG